MIHDKNMLHGDADYMADFTCWTIHIIAMIPFVGISFAMIVCIIQDIKAATSKEQAVAPFRSLNDQHRANYPQGAFFHCDALVIL